MNVLGIDLSLTGTGMALIETNADELVRKAALLDKAHSVRYFGTETMLVRLNATPVDPMRPVDWLKWDRWNRILDAVLLMSSGVQRIVIESYAYGALGMRESLAEIGGIVRWQIMKNYGVSPLFVGPMTLKKFLTGSGKSEKDIMLKEVYKRYGVDVDDNNMADAFVLAKIGHAIITGCEGLPMFQAEIAAQIAAGPQPKKKKAKAGK